MTALPWIDTTDMTGRTVTLPAPPKRIVSLVPSQTELLYDLGLAAEVAGITRFCVHPGEWFRNKARVGGTKSVKPAAVAALRPDLILANKEENVQEQVEALAAIAPVWVSDIATLEDALEMISEVGRLCNRMQQAAAIQQKISKGFTLLQPAAVPNMVAYLIWRNPWMAAGNGTFIDDMLRRCGWRNALSTMPRYPVVTPEMLAACGTELVLLSSEPYPFKARHIAELQAALPEAKILLVDGEMFSWYGSRLLLAAPYFAQLGAEAAL